MRGRNGLRGFGSPNNLRHTASTKLDFVAICIDDACSRLILGLELDLALERFDLLRVEKVTILVAILNLLLPRDDALAHRVGTRLLLGGLLLLVHNGLLSLRRRVSHSRPLNRALNWGLGSRLACWGNSVVIVVLIIKRGVLVSKAMPLLFQLNLSNAVTCRLLVELLLAVQDIHSAFIRQCIKHPLAPTIISLRPLGHMSWGYGLMGDRTYAIQEGIAVKIPSAKKLDPVAFSLGPGVTVGQRREQPEDDHRQGKEQNGAESVENNLVLDERNPSSHKVKDLAEGNDGEVQGREVMMQEELTLHKVEGEIMKSPSEDRGSDFVIKAFEDGIGVIIAAALPAENSNALEKDVDNNSSSSAPPNDGVAHQVNLAMLPAPEVDTTAEDRPSLGARIPGMRLNKAGIRLPHDLLKLPELAEEARVAIVDLLGVSSKLRMVVELDIPKTVGKGAALGACDFLLLRGPSRKFNLVGEKNTARHDVHQLELGVDGTKTFLSNATLGLLLDNFDTEKVVGISIEALIAIS